MKKSTQEVEWARPKKLDILSDKKRHRIYASALEVMDKTGLRIPHEDVLAMLKRAGCRIDNDIVHIPLKLVETSLGTVPKSIQFYTREGESAMTLGEGISYFGGGADSLFILDPQDGKRRPFTKRDVEQGALVQDALPNIDFVMSLGTMSDIPDPFLSDLHQFQAMLFNTSKPINFASIDVQGTSNIIEMATVVAGSEKNLREKPFIFQFGCGSTPPLTFMRSKLDKLLMCCDRGIPAVSLSVGGRGGTAPMTSAGQVVSTLAELMTVLVISQTRCAGAPIIIGGMPLAMDMHSGTFSFSAPEVYLTNAAVTEMIRFLGVPSYGTGGCSDAKTLDEQAAVECSVSSYLQVFSGTDLIHDVGFIESGMTTSFDVLVLTDEVIQTVKRFFNGMEIDEAHLALDVIHKVGPGGHFLSESHTLENFRKEYWLPGLMDRDNYETWCEKGSMNFSERIKEKVKSILNNHRPLLIDGKKKTKILEIINRRR